MEYSKMGKLALSGLTLTALLAAGAGGHAHAAAVNQRKVNNHHVVVNFNNPRQSINQRNTRTYRNRGLYNRMRCTRVYRNRGLYHKINLQNRRAARDSADGTTQFRMPAKQTSQFEAAVAKRRKSINPRYLEQFSQINQILQAEIGKPYVYGATGPQSFDCSGFTQYVYKHGAHQELPRTAEAQRQFCAPIGSEADAQPGDLVFFGQGTAAHVGVYIGRDMMIDAQLRGVVQEHVTAPWWHLLSFGRPLLPPAD